MLIDALLFVGVMWNIMCLPYLIINTISDIYNFIKNKIKNRNKVEIVVLSTKYTNDLQRYKEFRKKFNKEFKKVVEF